MHATSQGMLSNFPASLTNNAGRSMGTGIHVYMVVIPHNTCMGSMGKPTLEGRGSNLIMHWPLNQKSNGMSIIPSVTATLFVTFHDNTSLHISQWLSHVVVNVVVLVIIYGSLLHQVHMPKQLIFWTGLRMKLRWIVP